MDKDNVVPFTGTTTLPIPVNEILEAALEKGLEEVLIIGKFEDGENYVAYSGNKKKDILWLLECTKFDLHTRY